MQFKKLNTASGGLITVTDDTANSEVDLKITAGTDGQFLKTVGTTPTWASLSGTARTMPDGSSYAGPRWGSFIGGATDGDGVLSGIYTEGSLTGTVGADYARTIWETSATDQEMSGWGTYLRFIRRQQTPRLKWRGLINPSTERGWVGFIDQDGNAYSGGDNPLVNRSGLMCGYGTANSNFNFIWNDGGATPQNAAAGVAKDNAIHTVELLIAEATGSVSAWFDGTQIVNANTTQVPATGTGLSVVARGQAVGATVTQMSTEYAMITYPIKCET